MKYYILLILFILTACGGGSGGQATVASNDVASPLDIPPLQYIDHNSGPLPVMREEVLPGMTSIVFEGESLMMLWDYTTWPTMVKNASTRVNTAWNDVAIGGTSTVDMLARYDANVRPLRPDIAGNGVLILNGGTGDLCLRLGDPLAIYSRLVTLWEKARLDGFKVEAFTIYSSCDVPGGTWENYRLTLNQLILSDPTLYDTVVRNDLVFPNVNDTHKLADRLHMAPGGNIDEFNAVNLQLIGL